MVYSRPPAPGGLRLVEAFCNTAGLLHGSDALGGTNSARAWMAEHGHPGAARISAGDLERLTAVREALRDRIEGVRTGAAAECLNAAARTHLSAPCWPGGGRGAPTLAAGAPASGAGAVVAGALAALAAAEIAQSNARLKVCAAPECRWVFYDRSPANSGSWCSMQICGARRKMRSYRTRSGPPPRGR